MLIPSLIPADGQQDVCPDTPLTLSARDLTPPRQIRIAPVTGDRDGEVVLEADEQGLALRTIGGARDDRGLLHDFRYRAITTIAATPSTSERIEIRLPTTLRPATDYRVEIEGSDHGWGFRTRPESSSGARALRVAADGSGQFCTVQAAIDAAPRDSACPVLIDVAAGDYTEILFLAEDCPPMIIRGAGRGRTKISSDNNNRLNGQPSDSRCRNRLLGDRDLYNGWRANVGVDAADIRFEDLTLINTTPTGGSQAEAFRGNQQRLVLNRVELLGHQDTLRMQGQGFLSHCVVAGTVDFVWGAGAVVHWRSEFRSRGTGYVFQVRNDAARRGHLLVDCRFTAEEGVDDHSVYVARTDTEAFPHSELIMIDCELGRHLHPAGGLIGPDPRSTTVRFAEHGSRSVSVPGVDAEAASRVFRQLDSATAADPADFLGGWVPYTVNSGTEVVTAGDTIPVVWSAPPDHDRRDRIGIAGRSVPVGSSSTMGELDIAAPERPGRYRLEYLPADGRVPTAIASVEVIAA